MRVDEELATIKHSLSALQRSLSTVLDQLQDMDLEGNDEGVLGDAKWPPATKVLTIARKSLERAHTVFEEFCGLLGPVYAINVVRVEKEWKRLLTRAQQWQTMDELRDSINEALRFGAKHGIHDYGEALRKSLEQELTETTKENSSHGEKFSPPLWERSSSRKGE